MAKAREPEAPQRVGTPKQVRVNKKAGPDRTSGKSREVQARVGHTASDQYRRTITSEVTHAKAPLGARRCAIDDRVRTLLACIGPGATA
jgi:hypothetical protein